MREITISSNCLIDTKRDQQIECPEGKTYCCIDCAWFRIAEVLDVTVDDKLYCGSKLIGALENNKKGGR